VTTTIAKLVPIVVLALGSVGGRVLLLGSSIAVVEGWP
jgi:hypothetical protein